MLKNNILFIHQKGDGKDLDDLNFELIGVLNIPKILENNSQDNNDGINLVYNFMKNGHPGKNLKYRPSMVLNIKDKVIAIFLATKDINPDSSRPLFTQKDIENYRKEFNILEFDPLWHQFKSFEEFKEYYLTNN